MFDMSRCNKLKPSDGSLSSKVYPCISYLPDLEITPVSATSSPSFISDRLYQALCPNTVKNGDRPKYSKEERDMRRLLTQLPILCENFDLHKKIGEGTYSTVYLASVKHSKSKQQYALKHLTQNFSLQRMQKELRFMQMIGGEENVVNVLNCFQSQSKECVVFVMPYLPHKKFSDYVLTMDAEELRLYMMNLFIALRRVHSYHVIHRDVKPGNFLYNRETKTFLLVDFGLAQEVNDSHSEKHSRIEGDGENTPINYSKRKRSSTDEGIYVSKKPMLSPLKSRENIINEVSSLHTSHESPRVHYTSPSPLSASSRKPLQSLSPLTTSSNCTFISPRRELNLGTSLLKIQTESKLATTPKHVTKAHRQSFTPLVANKVPTGGFVQVRNSQVVALENTGCTCVGKNAICSACAGKRVLAAPRAGTPGFRPPEVLLKYMHQTTAVDMWAAGVVMLCVLSGCYPFFKSPNDLSALAEIMTIFGSDAVSTIATKFGRRVSCSMKTTPLDLKKMCRRLRSRKTNRTVPPSLGTCKSCLQSIREDGCVCRKDEEYSMSNTCSDGDIFPDSAYHLLSRLLDLDPLTRFTADMALQHPFITRSL